MNETHDWSDMAKLWQADAAAVSVDEIDEQLRRQRRQMWLATALELAGAALGAGAALWMSLSTGYRWLGGLVAAFAIAQAVSALRRRREPVTSGTTDLLRSLKESLDREDWIAGQLRFGRALSFVAMFSVVYAAAVQLRHLHPIAPAGLWAAAAAAVFVAGALAWNLVLTRRARRRRERLEYLQTRLKS